MASSGDPQATLFLSVSLNMMLRLLTFLVNAIVLRKVTPEILGIVNVRLLLLYSTIQFLSREGFRRACYRRKEEPWTQLISLLWLSVPVTLVIGTIMSTIWIYLMEPPDPSLYKEYGTGVLIFFASALIENVAEPFVVVSQILLHVKLKIVIECVSLQLRAISCIFLLQLLPNSPIICFSVAQISSSLLYTSIYVVYFYWQIGRPASSMPFRSLSDFIPRSFAFSQPVQRLKALTWSFTKQSFLKQFLTEGEKYCMTAFNSLSFGEQGIYDSINNLGSLAARFIFLPIEEAASLVFSRLSKEENKKDSPEAHMFSFLLKLLIFIGLTIAIFGNSFSYVALDIYAGKTLSGGQGPFLLKWYSLYVLLLALNGITEAYVFSKMQDHELNRFNRLLVLFSAAFLPLCLVLMNIFGAVGLIVANTFNMMLRIVHSCLFISHRFASPSLLQSLPSFQTFLAFLLALVLNTFSQQTFCSSPHSCSRLPHISVGLVSLCMVALSVIVFERKFTKIIYEKLRSLKVAKKTNENRKSKDN